MKHINTVQAIWCSVGLILFMMGIIVLLSGLFLIFFHVHQQTVLANLQPDVWWGSFMIIVGSIFFLINAARKYN